MGKKIIAVNAGPRMGWTGHGILTVRQNIDGMRRYSRKNAGRFMK